MNTFSSPELLRDAQAKLLRRRWFFRDCGVSLAGMAAATLLEKEGLASSAPNPLAPRSPHYAPKAKRVISMFQAGAPSHLELYDFKPELAKRSGSLPPAELLAGYRAAFINPNSTLLGPKFAFRKWGRSGLETSELLPHIGAIADDICVIRSMQTDAVNHAPAQILMNTGSQQFGRPSFGAWTLYGLGSEAEDLPGYVVLTSRHRHQRRGEQLRRRLPPHPLRRHPPPRHRRSGPLSHQPQGDRSGGAAGLTRHAQPAQLARPRRGRRSGDRLPDSELRDVVPAPNERLRS